MKTAIHLKDKILPNPTRKTISSILKHATADYEMSLKDMKKQPHCLLI